jgi:hypothetical protein
MIDDVLDQRWYKWNKDSRHRVSTIQQNNCITSRGCQRANAVAGECKR